MRIDALQFDERNEDESASHRNTNREVQQVEVRVELGAESRQRRTWSNSEPGTLPVRRIEIGTEDMRLVASIVSGAWRPSPPPPPALSAADLARLVPGLTALRVAPLAWWRLRRSELHDHPAMVELHSVVLATSRQHAVLEQQIAEGIQVLNRIGLDPILGKGWLIARCYADPGLRPFADIDLSLPAEHIPAARDALKRAGLPFWNFDLQPCFHGFIDRSAADLDAHAGRVLIKGVAVRVLGPEDHLRLLCYHLLNDGVHNPLALADIAACLETLPPMVDWDYCLSGKARRTEYLRLALSLASRLIGASPERLPAQVFPLTLPDWVETAVLAEWRRWATHPEGVGRLSGHAMRGTLVAGLRLRWPNALQAAARYEAPIGERPQMRWQIRDWIGRAGGHLTLRTRRDLRRLRRANASGDFGVWYPCTGDSARDD